MVHPLSQTLSVSENLSTSSSPEAALLLVRSNTGSQRFTDFPSLCACSESGLTNLIGCDLNLLCLQSHSKTECRCTGQEATSFPGSLFSASLSREAEKRDPGNEVGQEVAILGADQKERGLWGREWSTYWLFRTRKQKPNRVLTICPNNPVGTNVD